MLRIEFLLARQYYYSVELYRGTCNLQNVWPSKKSIFKQTEIHQVVVHTETQHILNYTQL